MVTSGTLHGIQIFEHGVQTSWCFQSTGIVIGMQHVAISVNEDVDDGRVSVCAEIAVGVLQTDLTVTLSTTNGTKAGMSKALCFGVYFVEY